MISEWIGKDVEGNCRDVIWAIIPVIYLDGLRKTKKNLCQNSLYTGRQLNPIKPKYEEKMLPTQRRHSVTM
jgi:hypothetical protein